MNPRLATVFVFLPAPPGDYNYDLARTFLDDGDDLIHGDVTEAAKLGRQFFDTRRQGTKRNRLGYDAVDGDREVDMGQRLGFWRSRIGVSRESRYDANVSSHRGAGTANVDPPET